MAARCAVCGKGPQVGYTVSHSHIRNKRTFRPNLQPVRTTVDGQNVRVTSRDNVSLRPRKSQDSGASLYPLAEGTMRCRPAGTPQ